MIPHAVVEHEGYLRWLDREGFDEDVRLALVLAVASDPRGGDVVPESGGIRKIRAALPGRGKSGGVRLFFLYFGQNAPLLLLAGVRKGRSENLTKAERNTLRALVQVLRGQYPGPTLRRNSGGRFTMTSELFQDLKASLEEAIRGEAPASHETVFTVRSLCVMSQDEFARALGVSVSAVQSWEQGRRRPGATSWGKIRKLIQRRARERGLE